MITLIIAVFVFISSSFEVQPTIYVKFKIDDETFDLSDNFEILFNDNSNIKKAIISGDRVELPKLDSASQEYEVTFIYQDNRLVFKSVNLKEILPDQDMTWEFKIDNPPLYENYEGVEWSKVKKIYYWSFNPHEFGVGLEIIEPVFYWREKSPPLDTQCQLASVQHFQLNYLEV